MVWGQEVEGSNPFIPTILSFLQGLSSVVELHLYTVMATGSNPVVPTNSSTIDHWVAVNQPKIRVINHGCVNGHTNHNRDKIHNLTTTWYIKRELKRRGVLEDITP